MRPERLLLSQQIFKTAPPCQSFSTKRLTVVVPDYRRQVCGKSVKSPWATGAPLSTEKALSRAVSLPLEGQIRLELSRKGSVNVADPFLLGGTMPDSSISQRLASLPTLSKPALCELWHQLFKREPPPVIRKNLLLRIVAHRLQELEFGGLSDAACRRLRRLATAFEANPNAAVSTRPRIKPGTRLVRQWKEKVHVVEG